MLLMHCRHQLVKRTLEATAACRRDGKKTPIAALADGFGHATRTMTDTIDGTDDGVAASDHFLDTVQAIFDASVVMEKCRDPRCRHRAQVRNDSPVVAGGKCYPCVRYDLSPMSRVAQWEYSI